MLTVANEFLSLGRGFERYELYRLEGLVCSVQINGNYADIAVLLLSN